MDLTSVITNLPTITKDLTVFVPIIQLQGPMWLAVKQADVALTNAVQLWLVSNP